MKKSFNKMEWKPISIDLEYLNRIDGGVVIYGAELTCNKEIPNLVDLRIDITLTEEEQTKMDNLVRRVIARYESEAE